MGRDRDKESNQNNEDKPPRDTGWQKIEEHVRHRDDGDKYNDRDDSKKPQKKYGD